MTRSSRLIDGFAVGFEAMTYFTKYGVIYPQSPWKLAEKDEEFCILKSPRATCEKGKSKESTRIVKRQVKFEEHGSFEPQTQREGARRPAVIGRT